MVSQTKAELEIAMDHHTRRKHEVRPPWDPRSRCIKDGQDDERFLMTCGVVIP